jgi:hypothetical protein
MAPLPHFLCKSLVTTNVDSLPSNKTGGRIRALPLVLGMPVVITENFDVMGGIVNGSTGTLRKVRYRIDDDKRYITSCIVELADALADSLPNLPPKHVAVLPDEVEMKAFHHPVSGRSCTIRRFQVPLDAAFAITAHKAQGQTMTKVVVDLASCIGTESAYVMVSRCMSLEGLMILRPFPVQKISTHWSQEARDEFNRLDGLNSQTISECRDIATGSRGLSFVQETGGIGRALEIAPIFSGPNPPDLSDATQLLNQMWGFSEDRGTFCPILPQFSQSHVACRPRAAKSEEAKGSHPRIKTNTQTSKRVIGRPRFHVQPHHPVLPPLVLPLLGDPLFPGTSITSSRDGHQQSSTHTPPSQRLLLIQQI